MTKPAYDFSQMDFSRVCVIGSAGSGKTTFCKALGNLLGRQVTHLDKILWGENWTELTREQQVQILTSVVETDQWIIDGLWASTLEMRYKRATVVIFLNYKPTLCAWRAFTRAIKHKGKQRDDLATGCIEKIDFSFYNYILKFRKHSLPKIQQLQHDYPTVPVVCLNTPNQTQQFVEQLQVYINTINHQA
jgi:adenylate kinase family enzyme